MPKTKHNPPKDKNIHIIGNKFTEKDNEIINAAVNAIIEKVEPILNGIGQMVDSIDKRLAIVEEVKKIFPDKVEVVIKHENEGAKSELDSISFEDAVKRAGYKSVDAYLMQHGYKKEKK